VIARDVRREAHDRDVTRAVMIATLSRVKDPAALATKLYLRKPAAAARPQTAAEARAVARQLASVFGWKSRPPTAIVLED